MVEGGGGGGTGKRAKREIRTQREYRSDTGERVGDFGKW